MSYYQARAGLNSFGYTAVDSMFLPLTMLPLAALLDSSARLRALIGEPPWSDASSVSPGFLSTLRRTWGELSATPLVPLPAGAELGSDGQDAGGAHARWDIVDERTGLNSLPAPSPRQQPPANPGRTPRLRRCSVLRSLAIFCCHRLSRPWPYWFTLMPFHGIEFARTLLFFWLVTAFDTDATYLAMTLVRIALVWAVSMLACSLLRGWVGISAAEAAVTLQPANLAVRAGGSSLLLLSVLRLKGVV